MTIYSKNDLKKKINKKFRYFKKYSHIVFESNKCWVNKFRTKKFKLHDNYKRDTYYYKITQQYKLKENNGENYKMCLLL